MSQKSGEVVESSEWSNIGSELFISNSTESVRTSQQRGPSDYSLFIPTLHSILRIIMWPIIKEINS